MSMEVSTFVRYRPTWRGVVFVIALALIAGGVAAFLTYRQDPTYRARAQVFVGQILPPDTPDYLLRPIADDYQAALDLPRVTAEAAAASGEPVGAIAGGLTSELVSSTANVEVFYESTDAAAATTTVRVASRQALIALAQQDLAQAERAAASAERNYDEAVAALSAYEAVNGADSSVQHSELAADVSRTLEQRTTALDDVSAAELELDNAREADVISVGDPDEESQVPAAARAGVTAAVIAGMVALILLLLVDWRRRPKIRWSAPDGH
jgi:hypothetical protein